MWYKGEREKIPSKYQKLQNQSQSTKTQSRIVEERNWPLYLGLPNRHENERSAIRKYIDKRR